MSKGWRETEKKRRGETETETETERERMVLRLVSSSLDVDLPTFRVSLFFSLKPLWKHPHRHA